MPHTWYGPIAVWDGGLGIWGGIAAGAAVGIARPPGRRWVPPSWTAPPPPSSSPRRRRRWHYFNQELFGGPTSLPWGLEISPPNRPEGYLHYATFQPTFLYEIIWNLALAAFLVWLGHHNKIRRPGLFALYVPATRPSASSRRASGRPRPPLPRRAPQLLGRDLLALVGFAWFRTERDRPGADDPPVVQPRYAPEPVRKDAGDVRRRTAH